MRYVGILTILAAMTGVGAAAQGQGQAQPSELTPDQKGYIAYDRCMMQAAIQASRTPAQDEEIFGLAKAACGATRVAVTQGLESNKDYLAALDAADADKQANFPAWIKGVRERRRGIEAGTAGGASAK